MLIPYNACSRRQSVKAAAVGADRRVSAKGLQVAQEPEISERKELENTLDEALVQSTPGLKNKGMRKPSVKPVSAKAVSRRVSSVEISLQQSVKDNTQDLSDSTKDIERSSESIKMGGPPIEVGPPTLEPVADHPSTGNASSKRRMSTQLPALAGQTSASVSAPPDVYDALVNAARDASADKRSNKSMKAAANTAKFAARYGGKFLFLFTCYNLLI